MTCAESSHSWTDCFTTTERRVVRSAISTFKFTRQYIFTLFTTYSSLTFRYRLIAYVTSAARAVPWQPRAPVTRLLQGFIGWLKFTFSCIHTWKQHKSNTPEDKCP